MYSLCGKVVGLRPQHSMEASMMSIHRSFYSNQVSKIVQYNKKYNNKKYAFMYLLIFVKGRQLNFLF